MSSSKTSRQPKKSLYLNPKIQRHLGATQRVKVAILGRGGGKSFGNGISVAQKVEAMPRGIGSFLGASYTNILSSTILPMINAWEKLGYYEGIHYVIGDKPPKWFLKPYQPPQRYDNVVSWWCGHAMMFGSMDRPQLLRGGSRDYSITDEALLIKKEDYKQVVVPTLRGSDIRLQGSRFHRTQEFTSSMPYGSLPGEWILEYQEMMKMEPDQYHYIEGTSYDNIFVLGEDTLKEWRRDMGTIAFMIECLNKRIKRGESLFYPALSDRHFYEAKYDYGYIDSLGFNREKLTLKDSRWDEDCDTNLPINISHDWGAFNTITIDQYHERLNEVRFINHLWVKHPQIIDDLANNFCDYYQHHKKKLIYQWGDKSGAKREANAKLTNFEQFASILEARGWRVIKMKTGDISHLDRHNFISKLHREEDRNLPKVTHNANKCKDLRIALENAGMKDTQKDKSSERSKTISQEHATHSTDAYDYRLYHGYYDQSSLGGSVDLGIHFGGR